MLSPCSAWKTLETDMWPIVIFGIFCGLVAHFFGPTYLIITLLVFLIFQVILLSNKVYEIVGDFKQMLDIVEHILSRVKK